MININKIKFTPLSDYCYIETDEFNGYLFKKNFDPEETINNLLINIDLKNCNIVFDKYVFVNFESLKILDDFDRDFCNCSLYKIIKDNYDNKVYDVIEHKWLQILDRIDLYHCDIEDFGYVDLRSNNRFITSKLKTLSNFDLEKIVNYTANDYKDIIYNDIIKAWYKLINNNGIKILVNTRENELINILNKNHISPYIVSFIISGEYNKLKEELLGDNNENGNC